MFYGGNQMKDWVDIDWVKREAKGEEREWRKRDSSEVNASASCVLQSQGRLSTEIRMGLTDLDDAIL